MQRKIPATMVTQHPDNANKPYWHSDAFVNTQYEANECFLSFSDLDACEYNWDWEGKYVDESVIEKLYSEHFDYFKNNQIGKDVFLTFRLPNPEVQTEFRVGRAFMGILSASLLAERIGMSNPPLFEVILPMTENAEQMLAIQEAFREIATLEHRLFNLKLQTLKHLEIIPLFEEVNIIMDSAQILEKYFENHLKMFGFKPEYLRPYVARSDPALNAGIMPTVLAIKIALSNYAKLQQKLKIKLYPMIGAAALPFRGGINPESVEDFVNEYKGIKTTTIQSAFRYDYTLEQSKEAIAKLKKLLPKNEAVIIDEKDEKKLRGGIAVFEKYYKSTIENIADTINKVAAFIPKRRERVQHVGLFGYSRGVGKVKLPRAITFTASLYSLGIPPELIGTGRSIRYAQENGLIEVVEKTYINLKSDLQKAGKYLNRENLAELAKENSAWKDIQSDIESIEGYLGTKLEPKNVAEREHELLTLKIFDKLVRQVPDIDELQDLIVQAAKIRKSLG
jgi:phosphoenolpyruvate carboxylase